MDLLSKVIIIKLFYDIEMIIFYCGSLFIIFLLKKGRKSY